MLVLMLASGLFLSIRKRIQDSFIALRIHS